MADFNQNLNYILNSVYGKDVRRAIYDALVYLSNNQGSGSGGSGASGSGLYTLPVASSNTLGGIKTSSDFAISSDGKLSLANNKVVKKDGYADSEILNFLHVDINKKVTPVPLLGRLFELGTDAKDNIIGLEFSSNGRLWLLDFIENALISLTKDATMDSDGANIDELYNAYSVYFPLSTTENTSLYSVFGSLAEGAFVSAYSIATENGIRYVQAAIPVKSTTADSVLPGIATRSKREGRIWTNWITAGNSDSANINDRLATKLGSNEDIDTIGETYSMYFPLSASKNTALYNAFNGQASGAFISAVLVKDETGTVFTVQRATPVKAADAIGPLLPCMATRSKIHSGAWSEWNTSGSVYGGGSTDMGTLKNVAYLVADCLKNVAWANTLGSSKLNYLLRYVNSLGNGSDIPDNPDEPDMPDVPDVPGDSGDLDIPDVPIVDADGFETVRVISESEIDHMCGYTEKPPYFEARSVRECYAGFDVEMNYNYTYKFEWTTNCSENVVLGGQYYNQNVLNAVANNQTYLKGTDTADGAKWYSSGETFMLPTETLNGSPMCGVRFHFKKSTDGAFTSGAGVTSVTIKRKAGRLA